MREMILTDASLGLEMAILVLSGQCGAARAVN
jgi:hypothetical protein